MRLIDADAFKDYIRNALEETKHMYKDNGEWAKEITESFCKDIDEQPTITPEPHWIPVTERLPENSRNVLITHKGGVSMAWYNGVYFEKGASTHHRKMQTVTAWRELPEPYKEVTDGRD